MHDDSSSISVLNTLLDEAACCINAGRLKDAASIYEHLLQRLPDAPDLHHTLGLVHLELADLDRAIYHIQQSIELQPKYAKGYRSLGDVYAKAGHPEASLAAYENARSLAPKDVDNLINLGNTLHRMDRFHEALRTYRCAIDLSPDNIKALNNTGKIYHDMQDLGKAVVYYDRCIQLDPNYAEARFNRSVALLAMGDYQKGWPEYEWRFRRHNASRVYPHALATPRWKGQPYRDKRLLVHCEQGMGDALQFIRYLPWVKQLGGTLILEAHEPLASLFKDLPYVDELVIFDAHRPPTLSHHLHIPLMSLPGLFNLKEEDFSKYNPPYLHSDAAHQQRWRSLMVTDKIKIGLVWAGSDTNPKRNCPLNQCLSWFQIPGIQFYSLQKGAAADQLSQHAEIGAVDVLGHRLADFRDTAAVVANLDLIISVDTAVVHLAGAMSQPVWVLLPYGADWRWPPHRKTNPWYPSARIFRQARLDDWTLVIDQVDRALSQWRQKQQLVGQKTLDHPYRSQKKHNPGLNSPYGGLRMQRPLNPRRPTVLHNSKADHLNHPCSKPVLNRKIQKVMLVSPIYGGSYEVIRHLFSGFTQAGFNTTFQDNSRFYPTYQHIDQGPWDTQSKEQLFGRMIAAIDQHLLVRVEQHKPDMVLAIAQAPIHNETIAKLKKRGIVCAYWFVEDYRFRQYWAQIAPLYDYFFTIQRGEDLKRQFIDRGLSNWHYLPLACDPEIHKPWHAAPEKRRPYRCQIGFMGAPYLNRLKMFDTLSHWDLGIWGEGWDDHDLSPQLKRCVKQGKDRVSVSQAVKIYSASDIVVNLHSSPFSEEYCGVGDFVNPRTFEVAGCSGFQLCDNRKELSGHFTPEKEIILFNSQAELKELIPYYIQRPDIRKEIALRAQKRAYAEHTYKHRANEMVRIIEK